MGTLEDRNWLISAPDEECRQQGVRAMRRSIDLARKLGARAVVVHAGKVELDPKIETTFWKLVATYLPNDAIIHACEFRHYLTSEQVMAGLQFLADKGCIARP